MAVFKIDEVNEERPDWSILRFGGVALYWRPQVLADDLNWLEANGYSIASFETADWISEDRLHESLKAKLSFPAYYGNNLNALDECMWDDLVVPDAGGLVLVLNHYDRFVNAALDGRANDRSTAEIVLDIFARASRYHMLSGRRLIILVQSDDPKIQFGVLGGMAASWNWREWLNKDRGF